MATRNKTELYLQYRHQKSVTRPKLASPVKEPSAHLLDDSQESKVDIFTQQRNLTRSNIELGGEKMKLAVPPGWMAAIEDVHYNIAKIKENSTQYPNLISNIPSGETLGIT